MTDKTAQPLSSAAQYAAAPAYDPQKALMEQATDLVREFARKHELDYPVAVSVTVYSDSRPAVEAAPDLTETDGLANILRAARTLPTLKGITLSSQDPMAQAQWLTALGDLKKAVDEYDQAYAARAVSAPAAAPGGEALSVLRDMTALFEMGDEANTPGTDSYTVLMQARALLSASPPLLPLRRHRAGKPKPNRRPSAAAPAVGWETRPSLGRKASAAVTRTALGARPRSQIPPRCLRRRWTAKG